MKEGYYLPEIEEFCYGFEYEMVPSQGLTFLQEGVDELKDIGTIWAKEYKKGVFGIEGVNVLGEGFAGIQAAIEGNKIRVKKLDIEYIKSIGFIYDEMNDCYVKDEIEIYVPFDEIDEKFLITEIIDGYFPSSRDLYHGIIKNKFEFKKLLKRLEIDD